MLDQVLSLFEIEPDYDLDLMRHNQTLCELTAGLFAALEPVVKDAVPDWILAEGDTTTVFVAAMVAFYHGIAFGHVEAGLRTGDRARPFPEEINRRLADLVATAYFAPTENARQSLLREGCAERDIYVTGNTVVDALRAVESLDYDWQSGPLSALPMNKRLVLITAHRREMFGDPFRELCLGIRDLSRAFEGDGVHFVYPVHLNPNVRQPVSEILAGLSNISLIEPLDYISLVNLMKRATLVLTDSGGIQEEAPALRIPVLVMRDTTERPEGIQEGVVRLVGTTRVGIVSETAKILRSPDLHRAMTTGSSPYGDGHAAERIVSIVLNRLGKSSPTPRCQVGQPSLTG
jgi:UDP-N-acetylglucosamine 2-epimerase